MSKRDCPSAMLRSSCGKVLHYGKGVYTPTLRSRVQAAARMAAAP